MLNGQQAMTFHPKIYWKMNEFKHYCDLKDCVKFDPMLTEIDVFVNDNCVKNGVIVNQSHFEKVALKDFNADVKPSDFCLENLIAAGVQLDDVKLFGSRFELLDSL